VSSGVNTGDAGVVDNGRQVNMLATLLRDVLSMVLFLSTAKKSWSSPVECGVLDDRK
jgi:hypothetical protein